MTQSRPYNDRFPTDPFLIFALALLATASLHQVGQLTLDQAQALSALGTIAELALTIARFARERR